MPDAPLTRRDAAYKQIVSPAWRLARIVVVCDRLQQALTHPTTPKLTSAALAAYRNFFEDYPEPQPPPGHPP